MSKNNFNFYYISIFLLLTFFISSFNCEWNLRPNEKKIYFRENKYVNNLVEIMEKPISPDKKTDKSKNEENSYKLKQTNNTKRVISEEEKDLPEENPKNINPNFNAPDFTLAKNINCTKVNCMYPNQCLPDNKTCKCALEYAEYLLNKNLKEGEKRIDAKIMKTFCNYKRKSKFVYFLLEIIFNIGLGHLYAGNLATGIVKLTLVFLPCFIFSVLMCMGIMSSSKIADTAVFGYCMVVMAICAVSMWWLCDVILISIGYYTDGNGVPLLSW